MPVLMVALLCLAVFGGIGVLLSTAVLLEHRMHNRQARQAQLHDALAAGKH